MVIEHRYRIIIIIILIAYHYIIVCYNNVSTIIIQFMFVFMFIRIMFEEGLHQRFAQEPTSSTLYTIDVYITLTDTIEYLLLKEVNIFIVIEILIHTIYNFKKCLSVPTLIFFYVYT